MAKKVIAQKYKTNLQEYTETKPTDDMKYLSYSFMCEYILKCNSTLSMEF